MLDLIEMSHRECEDLLRAGIVGRVAFSTPSGPYIVPVNYAVVDDAVMIRTTPYSLLGAHGRDATLAFEVDLVDYPGQCDWSVVARGRARAITDTSLLERIRTAWGPRPWPSGTRTLMLGLPWTELTGRRLGSDRTRDQGVLPVTSGPSTLPSSQRARDHQT